MQKMRDPVVKKPRLGYNVMFEVAAMNNNIERIKQLVKEGYNHRDRADKAFVKACRGGHLEIVKYFVALGTDISVCGGDALINSCRYGQLNVVKYLVENGVPVRHSCTLYGCPMNYRIINHPKTDYFCTMEHVLGSNSLDIVKYLVEVCGVDGPAHRESFLPSVSYGSNEIFDYFVDLTLNEIKKYTILLILNNSYVICKDLFKILLDKFVRYRKYYQK